MLERTVPFTLTSWTGHRYHRRADRPDRPIDPEQPRAGDHHHKDGFSPKACSADGGDRTHTLLPVLDFEACESIA